MFSHAFLRSLFMPMVVYEGEAGGGGSGGGGNGGGSGGSDGQQQGGGSNENMVPQSRFSEVANERAAAQRKADELQARLDAIEAEGQSELQKAIQRAEKAEGERDSLKGTVATMKRDTFVKDMAKDVIDTDAVTALLATERYGAIDVDKPETVTAALEKLKEAKPTLFVEPSGEGQQQQNGPQAMGRVQQQTAQQQAAAAQQNNNGNNNADDAASERSSMGQAIGSLLGLGGNK